MNKALFALVFTVAFMVGPTAPFYSTRKSTGATPLLSLPTKGQKSDSSAGVTGKKDNSAWWPQFLGPHRDGISRDVGINTDWKNTPPKTVWKVPLGDGFGSFSIVGDRVYTMCQRNNRGLVVCLDSATGKEIWTQDVAPGYIDKQRNGAGPRSTPAYHDGKLYCLMPMGELVCLAAADGKLIWSANQFKDTGSPNPAGETFYWGVSASPLVEGDLVIVQPGGKEGNSIAAYHKDTGKLLWTVGGDPPGYSTGLAVTIAGLRQLIVPTGQSVVGIDPANGRLLWRFAYGNKSNVNGASPLWVNGLLYVSAAYGTGSAVLDITRQGDEWAVEEKWKDKKGLQALFATPMIVDGHVYGCHGDLRAFMLKCVDFKTGEVKWEERVDNRQWLLAVDGHLLCWSETGTLKLLETQPKEMVVKGELPKVLAPKAWAAPAMAEGRLYLRDQKNAVCIDLRKP